MSVTNLLVAVMLKLQKIPFGKRCRFRGFPVIIAQKASISIGDRCSVNSGFLSNLIGLYQRSIILARNGGSIRIGNSVAMSATTIYAYKHIHIGDHTMIGANTKIFDSDFHPLDSEIRMTAPNDKEHTQMAEVVIGKNVFIGCNCLILKGVHIGDNAVIGAGSVVTKDIPANTIAAGNPAKVVKTIDPPL